MQNGIRVRIYGDDSDLKKTLGDSAKRIAKWSAVASTAAAVGGAALVKSGLENVDAQAKLAKQLNTTSADLAKVKRAFDLAGVSQEQLRSGTRALTNRLSQAAQGTGPAADAFEKLGLSLEFVNSLPLSEKIDAINTALNNNVDENERAAIAAKIYGEEAALAIAKIDPNTIRRAGKEVEALGAAFTEIDAKKVEDANDALGALGLAAGGVRDRFTIELAPAITAVAESIKEEFIDAGSDMQTAIKSAANASIEAFATLLEGAGTVLSFIDNNKDLSQFGVLGYVIYGKKGALIGAGIGATFQIIKEGLASVGVGITDNEDKARRLAKVQEEIIDLEVNIQNRLARIGNASPEDRSAFMASAQEAREDLREEQAALTREVNSSSESLDYFNEIMYGGTGAAATLGDGLQNVADKLRDLKTAQDEVSGGQSTTETTNAISAPDVAEDPEVIAEQNKRDKMLAIYQDYATQRGASGENFRMTDLERQKAFNDAQEELEEDTNKQKWNMANSAFGNLSSLMESENKKMFEVGKVAALAQAAMDGYAAVASSYRVGADIGGPVVGAAFAATAGVAAAQNFANIQNTSFGSKSAPSAPGGGSNPQVPQQQEQQQQQSEPERVLRLERLDPSALVSGEVVNRLAEELVQYQKDGFNLVAS